LSAGGFCGDVGPSGTRGRWSKERKRNSRSEHFGQESKGFLSCGVVDFAQPLHQSYFVHGADLVQDDLAHFSLEPDGNPGRIVMSFCCHGRDNDGADMTIHLIRRDDKTRPGFTDLSSLGGIKANKVNLEAGDYHSHSVLSQRVGARESRSRSASPPSWAILWKASSHPLRGFLAGRTTKWLFSTSSSTVSARRHCSNSVLGMRIPRELPIRTTVVFMGITLS